MKEVKDHKSRIASTVFRLSDWILIVIEITRDTKGRVALKRKELCLRRLMSNYGEMVSRQLDIKGVLRSRQDIHL